MPNDNHCSILGLDADAVWLATTAGTKSMLCKYLMWAQRLPRELRIAAVGDFVKRVSYWHQYTLIPVTTRMQCYLYLNPPSFSKFVLQEKLREIEGTANNMFELNIQLLTAASNTLLSCLDTGLGPRTKSQIVSWFMPMSLMHQDLLSKAKASTQIAFQEVLDAYTEEMESVRDDGEQNSREYFYFHHKNLFIHIAHMVIFTCVETKSTKCGNFQIKVSTSMLEQWEEASGRFFNRRLKLPSNGFDTNAGNDADPALALIVLPRKWFRKATINASHIPSVHDLHFALMNTIHGKIHQMMTGRGMGTYDQYEADRLTRYITITSANIMRSKHVLMNREKVRRSLRKKGYKKYGHNYQYKPEDPTMLERDMFLLGFESYYYLYNTEMGRGYREMLSATTEVRVIEVEVLQDVPNNANLVLDNMMDELGEEI